MNKLEHMTIKRCDCFRAIQNIYACQEYPTHKSAMTDLLPQLELFMINTLQR